MKLPAFMMHVLLAFFWLIGACTSSPTEPIESTSETIIDSSQVMPGKVNPGKVLVVYLSRTNNTRALAEIIHRHVGGTLVALELSTPYPANYQATVQQVARENETGFLPPLKTKIDSIQTYDVVFVGFPTWGMQLPPPMKSFLRQYNFSGKTIIPFNSNGGYGIGSTFDTVKQLCPNSNVVEGFTMRGGSERDGQLLVIQGDKANEAETAVIAWLRKINLLK